MILGDLAKAGEHAEKLLATVNSQQDSWNYGNAIFEAHTILGRVALRRNDVKAACRHLIDSGRTPGSPQLNSFGPNTILADQLLERGEDKTVLEFLSLCSVFWLSGKDRLDKWLQDVRDRAKPGARRRRPGSARCPASGPDTSVRTSAAGRRSGPACGPAAVGAPPTGSTASAAS